MRPTLLPSDDTVQAFLRGSMTALVATRSPKGRPFVTPLWFVVDDGLIYVTTAPGTWAARNVVEHPEVVLLFTGERLGRPDTLRLHGRATALAGLPSWRVLMRIAAKYYLAPGAIAVELSHAGQWRLRQRYYGQAEGGFGHLRIAPESGELLTSP
jgi:hypothetical protein